MFGHLLISYVAIVTFPFTFSIFFFSLPGKPLDQLYLDERKLP